VHVLPFTPSQVPPQGEFAPLHAGRFPTGTPVTGTHSPALPGTLQASHCPMQSLLQQTPSTQWPLRHSPSREHEPPLVPSGLQTPPRQNLPAPHSPSVEQPSHFVGPHTWSPQSCVRAAGQEPVPVQNSASVATPLAHEAERHWTLEPGSEQDCVLMPLHVPVQAVPSPGQSGRFPTGAPVTAEHVPIEPGRLQASHCPEQSSLQQTPSTQNAVVHWSLPVQGAPGSPLGVQVPLAVQKSPCVQSVSAAHFVRHAVEPHTNWPHDWVAAAGHVALVPVQFEGSVSTPFVQVGAWH
jgi:hypothetical protein